jgi:hypothetical protein
MSYLDIPRIHFGGRFFTDPSTVNNDPTHYDPNVTTPSPWQNPNGQHRFEFLNCLVKSAVGPNGFAMNDTIIGSPVASVVSKGRNISKDKDNPAPNPNPSPSPGRIVDLDVYNQGVTVLYGLQITLTVGTTTITGKLDPPSLNNYWFNAVLPTRSWEQGDYDQDSFGGDMNACGVFHSALRINIADWPVSSSDILNSLRAATLIENNQYLVAFNFVVDGYRNTPEDSQYLTGRIVGTMGPVFANEPLYNPGQRWLLPRAFTQNDPWNFPSFNNCPFKVDVARKRLVIDMANSICRQNAGGPPVDLGILKAVVTTPEPVAMEIGTIDYSSFSYENNAQVNEMPLNDTQLNVLQQGNLQLTMSRTDIGEPTVLFEPITNAQIAVEVRPIRMAGDPGTMATTRVYVSKNGAPLPNKQLAAVVLSLHGGMPGVTAGPSNKGNTPQADGALQATVTASDQFGFATVTLKVLKDPGKRTAELDGQLYFVVIVDPDVPHPDWTNPNSPPPPQPQTITCLAFSQYVINQNPAWEEIQTLMVPFAKLYASMRDQIDLTDLHTFTIFSDNPPWNRSYNDNRIGPLGITAGAIPYYMSVDFNDPRFMPITRDMSDAKIMTIMYFVKNIQSQLAAAKKTTT